MHHTCHETWPDQLRETPVYRNWDGNYAVSRHVQRECVERLGFAPRLLHLGVDTEHFRESGSRSPATGDLPVILHPARLLPWKGVHVSVRMLAALRDRGVDARLLVTDTQRIDDYVTALLGYYAGPGP